MPIVPGEYATEAEAIAAAKAEVDGRMDLRVDRMSESTKLLLEWHEEYPLATFDEIANELEAKDAEIARLIELLDSETRRAEDSHGEAQRWALQVERLKAALEFYAEPENYQSMWGIPKVYNDAGAIARKELEGK